MNRIEFALVAFFIALDGNVGSHTLKYRDNLLTSLTPFWWRMLTKRMTGFYECKRLKLLNITLAVDKLIHLPYDERYKSKNEDPGDRWYSDVKVKYIIGGYPRTLELMAIDNCYVDLIPKHSKSGSVAQNYGRTWVNVYIPKSIMKSMIEKFKADTNWGISNKGLNVDSTQGLTSITANIDDIDHPPFYAMAKEFDDDDQFTGRILTVV
ncbi:hypothetical protein IV203_013544 [Nitzschia inconspicua]|uniref:Uncharacterized protein n=1 Tax=Nitzschia inconspicua TaxID=303405 RepID=A0A9K3M5A4_9STRA|nr:hypothetical protein IV203_013544 [Nitzschia inconspicua]